MGSGYYGEMNMGSNNNGSSLSNSGSSSRRKKKSSNSLPNKPKQPQRGLGVAQLEKIRLHGQLGCSSYVPNDGISPGGPYMGQHNLDYSHSLESYGSLPPSSYGFHQPNMMMGVSDMERPNMGWNLNSTSTGYGHESQQVHYSQADYMTIPFFSSQEAEESRRNKNEWGRSGSHDSGSSDTQQGVDLELRL